MTIKRITAAVLLAASSYPQHLISQPELPLLMQFESEATEKEAHAAGIVGLHSHRFARVQLNSDVLLTSAHGRFGNEKVGMESLDGNRVLVAGQVIGIEPFPGERYQLHGRHIEVDDGGIWSWVGEVVGHEHGEAILTFDGERVYGTFRAGTVIHEYRTAENGITFVREPNPDAYGFEAHCSADDYNSSPGYRTTPTETQYKMIHRPDDYVLSGGQSTIDVMVLYSPAVASRYNVASLVNNSVASLNTSFINSNASASVRIVHYDSIDGFDESSYQGGILVPTDIRQISFDMRDSQGPFSSVPALRDTHDADLVIFLFDGSKASGACGYGLIPLSSTGDDSAVYSTTGDECILPFNNFTHEIGHTLGGRHDYISDPYPLPYPYSRGHSSTNPSFMTIMGSVDCHMSSCSRLNRWSNPLQSYMGVPLGVPMATPPGWGADMTQALNNMTPVVAAYRTPSATTPSTPATMTVIRGYCHGINLVDWSVATGTVGWYEIESSTSSSFTLSDLVYRGPISALQLMVSTSTYIRGRACNSNACSPWELAPLTAEYFPYCL